MPSGLSWNHQAGPSFSARIVAGERRQLARVGGLVEREEDDRQVAARCRSGRAAASARGRSRCASGCRRPCRGRSAANSRRLWLRNEPGWICITSPSSRLIARHLGQHLRAEQLGVLAASQLPPTMRANSASASAARQVGGRARSDGRDRSRSRPCLEERRGACGARRDSRSSCGRPRRSARRTASSVGSKSSMLGIDHRIGPVGGDHAARSSRCRGSPRDARAVSSGAFGGREHLDVEALEQRARPELRRSPAHRRCGRSRGRRSSASSAHVDPEHLGEDVVEPEPRRRAAEQVVVLGEQPPDLARIGARRAGAVGTPSASSGTPWL